mgnify:CR=1 FL=1
MIIINLIAVSDTKLSGKNANPVKSVVPTFIQEAGESARAIEDKIKEFGSLPEIVLSPEDVESVRLAGDNTGCMKLRGLVSVMSRVNVPMNGQCAPNCLSLPSAMSWDQSGSIRTGASYEVSPMRAESP